MAHAYMYGLCGAEKGNIQKTNDFLAILEIHGNPWIPWKSMEINGIHGTDTDTDTDKAIRPRRACKQVCRPAHGNEKH